MLSKEHNTEDMKSGFQFPNLGKRVEVPTYPSIGNLEVQLIRNVPTVEIRLPNPHTNLSGLVESAAVYILRTGAPFPRPTYPWDNLVYPARAAAV